MDTTELLGYGGALLVGLVLGLIGGGGSILTVPLLVYLLGYNPVVATAYSLFVVGSTSVVGTFQKFKKGMVDFKTGFMFSFPSFISVYLTRRYLISHLPQNLFSIGSFEITKDMLIMVLFAIIMLLAAFFMIKKGPPIDENSKKQAYYKTFFQGIVIGGLTGIIGAGGGFLYVPALVLWAKLPMKKAVGTSLIIVAINSLIGFFGDVQNLAINWTFLLIFTSISIIGILIGVSLTKFVSGERLKKSFGYFILVMAVYIMYMEFS
ncbi:sulfite exporter TauE/SafE family protein [Gaetbulibacter sp. M240]|uniref:sulfite exporter TauE/SafE family protein n=1 Tax=Gaetbulibacter sp. M240 TaxID=3126511 RepID=UPI00374FD8CC